MKRLKPFEGLKKQILILIESILYCFNQIVSRRLIIRHSNRKNQLLGTYEIVPTTIFKLEQTLEAGPLVTVFNDPGDLELLTSNLFLQKGANAAVAIITRSEKYSDFEQKFRCAQCYADGTRTS